MNCKISKIICLILSLGLAFNTVNAKPENVYPQNIKKGDVYIDVINVNSDEVSFNKCWYKLKTPCKQIGPHKLYRISDLQDQRFWEGIQIGGAVIGDIVMFLAVAATGGSLIMITLTPTAAGAGILNTIANYVGIGTLIRIKWTMICNLFIMLKS